jgi:Cu(I)/Ag(I) efflux system membrane protein CusA/SilA
MYGAGAGSEVMQRIAAPMVGGMITAPLLSLFVIPAAWRLLQERRLRQATNLSPSTTKEQEHEIPTV